MDDTTLISELVASYRRQLSLYQGLTALVQKTLSQVIMSRGDVSGLMGSFGQKKDMLESILAERSGAEPLVKAWHERKDKVTKDSRTAQLDSLLSKTQAVIQEFLDSEEQLKKYLEHVVRKGNAVS
jgi:hypothetical protein